MQGPIRGIPYIDPNVEHVGVERLNEMSVLKLRRLKKTVVVRDGDSPVAVLIHYKTFLRMQEELTRLRDIVDEYEADDDSLFWGNPAFGDLGALDSFDDEGEFEGLENVKFVTTDPNKPDAKDSDG